MESSRRTTKTLYVVAALYVAIGLIVAGVAAFTGDRLSTFLGFLIISGALATAVLMQAVHRLTSRVVGLAQRLDHLDRQLERIGPARPAGTVPAGSGAEAGNLRTLDLSSVGPGDLRDLTAATLDRGHYPRLVTVMESAPSVEGLDAEGSPGGAASASWRPAFDETEAVHLSSLAAVTTRNLMREWRVGLREGNLIACRRIFSALVDTTDSSTVLPLSVQLQELTLRTEQRLRGEFTAAVRVRNFEQALAVGAKICQLLPDHAISREFERLRPHLQRKLRASGSPAGKS